MKSNKTGRAEVRITEETQIFIDHNDLSKSKIFHLGYEILKMCVESESVHVTVKTSSGETRIYNLLDLGVDYGNKEA